MRRWAIAVVVCAASGVGCRVSNVPFSTGAVKGRLAGAGEGALVFVLGRAHIRAGAGADGAFELAGIPVGEATLVAMDAAGNAALFTKTVRGADVADAGEVAMRPGAFLDARVLGEGGVDPAGATLSVQGTPLAAVRAGPGGVARLGPLPPIEGGWEVAAGAIGFVSASARVDPEPGEAKRIDLRLALDAGLARRGCAAGALSCPSGTHCDEASGACRECTSPAHCAAGWGCDAQSGTCVGATDRPLCARCESDDQCGGAADRCLGTNGSRRCGRACVNENDCPRGFACAAGQCQPLAAGAGTTCSAYAAAGHSCALADADPCGAGGTCITGGGAVGRCSVSCASDHDCPAPLACVGGMCR